MPIRDLSGQRFGKLTVLRRGENKGQGRAAWICKCDCGQIVTVRDDGLKSGHSKSCGTCLRSDKIRKYKMVPVPLREVSEKAIRAGLPFGEYVAKEYVRRIASGG